MLYTLLCRHSPAAFCVCLCVWQELAPAAVVCCGVGHVGGANVLCSCGCLVVADVLVFLTAPCLHFMLTDHACHVSGFDQHRLRLPCLIGSRHDSSDRDTSL